MRAHGSLDSGSASKCDPAVIVDLGGKIISLKRAADADDVTRWEKVVRAPETENLLMKVLRAFDRDKTVRHPDEWLKTSREQLQIENYLCNRTVYIRLVEMSIPSQSTRFWRVSDRTFQSFLSELYSNSFVPSATPDWFWKSLLRQKSHWNFSISLCSLMNLLCVFDI